MLGTPVSESQWRTINLVAAVSLLLLLAVLPIAVLPLWKWPRTRLVLLGLCWILAVGFVMHGVIDDLQRVLSLTGLLHLNYPFFATVDRRAADIQDLLFNETWFLLEGALWGILGWMGLSSLRGRRWWLGTACAAVAVLTAVGLLAAYGVVGKTILG